MTKHSKIEPSTAKPVKPGDGRRSSLLERADAAFGLDRFDAARVPRKLPAAPRKTLGLDHAPASKTAGSNTEEIEPAAHAPRQPARQPAPSEPRIALGGPFQAIDREALRAEGLIVPEDPVSGLLEEFRIVKREVLADARIAGSDAARRLLVCSPHTGEGKTFCASNLAIALAAERDTEVLLIDADMHKPSLTRRLGIVSEAGLMDALADSSLRPENLAIQTDIDGLFIMPAGAISSRDTEYLASARTSQVLARLTSGAPNRYLIFDTPPALAASPAAELAAHCGQALLVVRAEQTSRVAIEDARQLLSACPDLKLLLNAAKYSPSGRRFGTYGERETY